MGSIKLSDAFVAETIANIKPHWGTLGWVTYKRTYARWNDAAGRTEEWHETVKRVIEGNINLDPRLQEGTASVADIDALQIEAEELFRAIYSLSATPSGRNLWISGTPYQEAHGDALNNCWFVAMRPQAYGESHIVPPYADKQEIMASMPFAFLFDQLMKGGGVGVSVTQKNVAQMPAVAQTVDATIVINPEADAYEEARIAGADNATEIMVGDADVVTVPDTREGWVLMTADLIDRHFRQDMKRAVVYDISAIRAKGAKIKGFGGVASGPAPLIELIQDVNDLLNDTLGEHLSSVDCTDIANLIGKTVVSGGVRRSAEIALGDADDAAFVAMKQDKEKLYHHRWASNNSVFVTADDTAEYDDIAAAIAENGEPGVVNLDLLRNYGRLADGEQPGIDDDVEGTNPCGEISLANGEACNLFEVFPNVAMEQGVDPARIVALGARFAKRVTFSPYDWEISRQIINKNRRIGVSLSGIQDWVLTSFGAPVVTGWDGDTPIYNQELINEVDRLYQAVKEADAQYSAMLHCNPSVKCTTVKPSGTVSKLTGVSEGMHFNYADHLIQRIRFQDTDPLLKALQAARYHIEPDVYSENTMVVEFPVKAASADYPGFKSAGEVSVAEQLANQAFLQKYWADNSVSCTITFQEDEKPLLAKMLRQYAPQIKSTSMLPYSGHGFAQAPKEPISAEDYAERSVSVFGDVQAVYEALHSEDKLMDLVDSSDCETGACPIK